VKRKSTNLLLQNKWNQLKSFYQLALKYAVPGLVRLKTLSLKRNLCLVGGGGWRSCSCGPKCHALVLDNQNRWQAPFYLCSQVAAMINAIDSCNWHIIYCRLLIIRIRNVGRSTSCSWRCWRRLNKPETAAPEWLSSLRLHTEENIRNCTGVYKAYDNNQYIK